MGDIDLESQGTSVDKAAEEEKLTVRKVITTIPSDNYYHLLSRPPIFAK